MPPRDEDEIEKVDLKENDLVTWFQVGLPLFLKKYGSYLMLAAALCLLAFELYSFYQKKQAAEIQSAWNELNAASSPGVENAPLTLQRIIDQYNVKPVQALAWLHIGNLYLETVDVGNPPEGYHGIKVTRDAALTKAEDAYHKILADFSDQILVSGAAHMGLAAVAEDRHNFDNAKTEYEALTAAPFADTPFAKVAQNKLAHLSDYRNAPDLAAFVPPPATASAPASFDVNSMLGPPAPSSTPAPQPTTTTAPAK